MKKLLLFITVLASNLVALKAQQPSSFNHENMTETANGMYIKSREPIHTNLPAELFYFSPEFVAVKVFLQDGTKEFAEARLNLESNFLEVNQMGRTSYFTPENTKGFYLENPDGGERLSFLSVKEAISGRSCFMEVLTEGKLNALLQHTVEVKQGRSNPALNYDKPPRVAHDQTLYVQREGEAAYKIKLSKNSVLSIFEEEAEQVHSYAKQQKLRYSRQEDFIKLLSWYNSRSGNE